MKRDNILARLFRALSGQSQSQLAEEIGVHPSLVGQWEMGQATPSAEHLRRVAATAGLTVEHGELILDYVETLRRRNRRRGERSKTSSTTWPTRSGAPPKPPTGGF